MPARGHEVRRQRPQPGHAFVDSHAEPPAGALVPAVNQVPEADADLDAGNVNVGDEVPPREAVLVVPAEPEARRVADGVREDPGEVVLPPGDARRGEDVARSVEERRLEKLAFCKIQKRKKKKKVVYTGVCMVHGASSSNWCVPCGTRKV